MYTNGLVSISFRNHSPETIIEAVKSAGLSVIEWGSDVHAPCTDKERIAEIAALQKETGISCCSYGTYFRLGVNPIAELYSYIQAAKLLGTNILRLWCSNKHPQEHTPEEKETLFAQCKEAAKIAEACGVILCLECHMKTYTETAEGALELMEAVNSPAFRMYWQPNQKRTIEENIANAKALAPFVYHIHVFQWKFKEKYPLETGIEEWRLYLQEFTGNHMLLLEFMPDDKLESLSAEATSLRKITEAV